MRIALTLFDKRRLRVKKRGDTPRARQARRFAARSARHARCGGLNAISSSHTHNVLQKKAAPLGMAWLGRLLHLPRRLDEAAQLGAPLCVFTDGTTLYSSRRMARLGRQGSHGHGMAGHGK